MTPTGPSNASKFKSFLIGCKIPGSRDSNPFGPSHNLAARDTHRWKPPRGKKGGQEEDIVFGQAFIGEKVANNGFEQEPRLEDGVATLLT